MLCFKTIVHVTPFAESWPPRVPASGLLTLSHDDEAMHGDRPAYAQRPLDAQVGTLPSALTGGGLMVAMIQKSKSDDEPATKKGYNCEDGWLYKGA